MVESLNIFYYSETLFKCDHYQSIRPKDITWTNAMKNDVFKDLFEMTEDTTLGTSN